MAIQLLPIFDAHKKWTLNLWNSLLRNNFDFFPENSSLLDGELNVAKTANEILNSLEQVIIDLKLTDNSRIKNQLPNILKLKLDGKLKELKGKDYNEAMDIILEVQNDAFDMILENDKIFKLYEMRCVSLSKISK